MGQAGSSYYAMGNEQAARSAYEELLRLDVYYDLSPGANPRLQALLDTVRDNTMASAMVRSEPAGAFVTLNGQLMGVTPIMLDGLVGGNEYSVDVYQVGYETEYYTLAAQSGHSHMLQFELNTLPDPGAVAVAQGAAVRVSSPTRPEAQVTSIPTKWWRPPLKPPQPTSRRLGKTPPRAPKPSLPCFQAAGE